MSALGCLSEAEADDSVRRYGQLYNRLRRGQVGLEEFFGLKGEIFVHWYSHAERADSIIVLKKIVTDAMAHGQISWSEQHLYDKLNHENDHALAGLAWANENDVELEVSFGLIRVSGLFGSRGTILFTEFPNESTEFMEPKRYVDFCEYVLNNSGRRDDLLLYGKK